MEQRSIFGNWVPPLLCSAALCFGLFLLGSSPVAAEPTAISGSSAEPTRFDRDDACLRDIFFTSLKTGFAVGDRGAILRTDDGGESWVQQPSPTELSLRSITFLSPRQGWIAGCGTDESSGRSCGVVLGTQDGGQTWSVLCQAGIPALRKLKFFSDQEGIAIGDATDRAATGVFSTADGGRTWTVIAGAAGAGWTAGEFASAGFALLAGSRGAVGSIVNGAVTDSQSLHSLRGFQGSSLDRDTRTVWFVGDGGMVVRSSDGGATWPSADNSLPPETKMVFDFKAVAAQRNEVWVAGSPGSMIWHSADGGENWSPQPTTETTPLYALRSVGNSRRVAVGALGKILIQEGSGAWRTVRGAGRRLAALAVHAHGSRLSLLQLTRDSLDRGYRVGAWSLVRRDIETDNPHPATGARQFEDAALSLGAATGITDWRLPVSLPGLDRNPQALMAEWTVLADQQLNDVLVATLVTQIRIWRPDVLILDDAPADDVPTQVIHAALPEATTQALRDQGRLAALWSVAGLTGWPIKRVFSRSLNPADGDLIIDPFEWAPQRQAPLNVAAASAAGRLGKPLDAISRRQGFHPLAILGLTPGEGRELFAGLALTAGGEARRPLPATRISDDEFALQAASRQRNFQRMSLKLLEKPGQAAILLGQLGETVQAMPDDQAALTLAMLGEDLRQRADWEAAEATFMELVTRYPLHPAARDARRWLITLWASGEIEYARGRDTQVSLAKVEQAAGADASGKKPVTLAGGSVFVGDLNSVLGAGARAIDREGPQGTMSGRRKLDADQRFAQTRQLLETWGKVAPDDLLDSDLKLQLASLYRRNQKPQEAEAIYTDLVQSTTGSIQRMAHGELWLVRPSATSLQSVYRAQRAPQPPTLDGVLSDPCWETARELPIAGASKKGPRRPDELPDLDTEPDRDQTAAAFAMIAYDGAYLYLAGSVPRDPRLPTDGPAYAGRPYDADLDRFDRLAFAIDINRDYTSAYRLEVDQRGWTRDGLWTRQEWNPKWHVACDADERVWRVEIAVPWEELTPQPPAIGTVFAFGAVRTMPAIGRRSWVWPPTENATGEAMGLLMLE